MNKNKLLLALFIIASCILGFIFNPYLGLYTISEDLRRLIQIGFQIAISIYVLAFYVFPNIIKAIKE